MLHGHVMQSGESQEGKQATRTASGTSAQSSDFPSPGQECLVLLLWSQGFCVATLTCSAVKRGTLVNVGITYWTNVLLHA